MALLTGLLACCCAVCLLCRATSQLVAFPPALWHIHPLRSSANTKVRFIELNINEGANIPVNRIESKSTTCCSCIHPYSSGVRTVGQIPEILGYIHTKQSRYSKRGYFPSTLILKAVKRWLKLLLDQLIPANNFITNFQVTVPSSESIDNRIYYFWVLL